MGSAESESDIWKSTNSGVFMIYVFMEGRRKSNKSMHVGYIAISVSLLCSSVSLLLAALNKRESHPPAA